MLCKGVDKEVFCRTVYTPQTKTTFFVPSALNPADAAGTQLKRGFFGAALRGHFASLPVKDGTVVFETQLVTDHGPAHFRPTKAKFYLMGKVKLAAGNYYKIG